MLALAGMKHSETSTDELKFMKDKFYIEDAPYRPKIMQ